MELTTAGLVNNVQGLEDPALFVVFEPLAILFEIESNIYFGPDQPQLFLFFFNKRRLPQLADNF